LKIRPVLALALSLLMLASIGSPVQAEDSAGVDLTVVVINPPSVETIIASPVGSSWTVLRATLTGMGTASSVDVYFEWGVDTGYGSTTPAQTMTHPGAFQATITGLTQNTTYHYRSVAVGDSTVYGQDMSFTTISPPPPGPKKPPPGPPPRGTTDVRAEVSTAGVFTAPVVATSDDGLCILDIPVGTVGLTEDLEPLAEITMVTMEEPPPPLRDAHVIGLAYDFGPDGATFEPAITLTFTYDPDTLPEGVSEEDLVIAYFVDGEWVELECVVDTETMTITASVSHFTTFAVIAVAPPVVEEEPPVVIKEPVVFEKEEEPAVVEEEEPEVVEEEEPAVVEEEEPVVVEEEEPAVVVEEEAPGINWALIGWIIGGVVVVGFIIFFLIRRRKAQLTRR